MLENALKISKWKLYSPWMIKHIQWTLENMKTLKYNIQIQRDLKNQPYMQRLLNQEWKLPVQEKKDDEFLCGFSYVYHCDPEDILHYLLSSV